MLLDGSLYIQFSNGDTKRQLPLRTSNRAMNLLEEQRQLLRKLRQLSHISGGEYIIGGESYLLLGLEEGVQYDVGVETGDVNIVVYFYDKAQTTHTSFPDGLEVYEFPNRQVIYICFQF